MSFLSGADVDALENLVVAFVIGDFNQHIKLVRGRKRLHDAQGTCIFANLYFESGSWLRDSTNLYYTRAEELTF